MSTNTGTESQLAVSYTYAKVQNAVTVTEGSNFSTTYKRPKFVEKLDSKFSWDRGQVESIDEIDRVSKGSDYYDGTRNLSYFSAFCTKFNKVPETCTKQDNCGWCYSSNTCIHGTSQGAVDSFLPRHFVFKGKSL